ncbi:MAG TPA: hypothetical protein PLW95_05675 [bacterium]|nr:hypothetical protein [bacterium]
MDKLKSYPLDKKVKELFERQRQFSKKWESTRITKEIYIELSESIVRVAVSWQDKGGRIIDPYKKEETSTATARFVGALGFLIRTGHCLDLIDICIKSMNRACEDLYYSFERPHISGPEFYVKECMQGYLALKDKVDKKLVKKWEKYLGEYDPEKNYVAVLSKNKPEDIHNFCTFGLAGESFKKAYKIADNSDFIERHLETQIQFFTEYGMYRDPNDPMTYDWTARMNLSLLEYFGYKGKYSKDLNEILRRGGLTTLLFLSTTGESPFGGRSNQYHFNEATISLICEYEANRYKRQGELQIAGAFKRTARLTALSIKRWLGLSPFRHIKNSFPPEIQHGWQRGYGFFSAYSLLIASQFGFAYLLADDSIEERQTLYEIGGYILNLPDAFHKVFATCCGYHIEIDTKADNNYDATGLGRIHKISIPTELGLSTPIASKPNYSVSVEPSLRNVSIGPGWEDKVGNKYYLSDLSDKIEDVQVKIIKEETEEVKFEVIYKGKFENRIKEAYTINKEGIEIEDEISGSVKDILVQIPLLQTDGENISDIKIGNKKFEVKYLNCIYKVECLDSGVVDTFVEPFSAPNRNGIYKVGCFKTKGNFIKYKLSLEKCKK